jgi:hypothetical protein
MSKSKAAALAGFLAAVLALGSPLYSQENQTDIEVLKKDAAKVFLDCVMCDLEYIKTEITFVNYVRDRKEADVHVLVTTQATGSGGREYTLTFIGQNGFGDINDVQKYFTTQTDTEDDIRRGLVEALKLGLMSYVGRTPIASRISVTFAGKPDLGPVRDKWNFWLFSLSSRAHFMGEESFKDRSINSSFSANRVTERSKVRLSISGDYSKNDFVVEDETIVGIRKGWEANGLFVWSLSKHWSAGFYLEAGSSTFSNIDFGYSVAPAIEYNLFPYSESTRRQLRFLYRLSLNPIRYRELTIFNKTRETLWRESLSVTLDIKEKWGTITGSFSGSHYFHDFKKYRLNAFGVLRLNVYKGLSLVFLGGRSWIHDQISLRQREPTLEELLLRTIEFPTNSNWFGSIGIQFTFGSIFTNVINPRFGSSGGGGMHIIIE